jgi:hypothetical protein
VADLVRRHLEQHRLARRLSHRGRRDELDLDRETDHSRVIDVEARVAERLVGRRRDEADHDIGALLPVGPAECFDGQSLPGNGIPVVDRAANGRLELDFRWRDEVDGDREAGSWVADGPVRVDGFRSRGPAGRDEDAREQKGGEGPSRGDVRYFCRVRMCATRAFA